MNTATIDEFPGYTFYRDGKVTNKYGQLMGCKNERYIYSTFIDKNKKKHKKYIHCMIIWAFSGEIANGREVDHINSNIKDNSYENLQYLTKEEHKLKTKENKIPKSNFHKYKGIHRNGSEVFFDSISVESICKLIYNNTAITSFRKSVKNSTYFEDYIWYNLTRSKVNINDNEIWKKCEIENIYASNLGNIKNKEIYLNPYLKDGYKTINLIINKKKSYKRVHTLVCSAFHGNKPEWASSVNHINEDKLDNRPENLEWSTPTQQADVNRLKIRLEKENESYDFISIKSAADFLHVQPGSISNCIKGKNKTICGYNVIFDKDEVRKTRLRGERLFGATAINKLDNDKNIIESFNSLNVAAKNLFPDLDISKYSRIAYNLKQSSIKNNKVYGYYWKIISNDNNLT